MDEKKISSGRSRRPTRPVGAAGAPAVLRVLLSMRERESASSFEAELLRFEDGIVGV